jgi:hypothetical protein
VRTFQTKLVKSGFRILAGVWAVFFVALIAYAIWQPGEDIRDGRHDRGSNAIWLAHGWLGGDEWFRVNQKTNQLPLYRDPEKIRSLAAKLRTNDITDVFPHLCPAGPDGNLPPVDDEQVERFLDAFDGCRVIPWVGGPNGPSVVLRKEEWRLKFASNIRTLLSRHPRLAGVQLNVEPLPSGDKDFLRLLEDVRSALPVGKVLSVAAYPPPTRWHPFPDVHWDETYFRQVASRCDQLAVMMYDAGQQFSKPYQKLMADWTHEVLDWSEGKQVLLGVPTYDDAGVGYHNPKIENMANALMGIHRGLSGSALRPNYQGVAIYCDWETDGQEWGWFRSHFAKIRR